MLLAIDTSAAVSVALVGDDATVLATRHHYDPRAHVERLVPSVEECLAQAGVGVGDVRGVVVGQGPGPFTGLRVGLVTARTFAYARELPLHGLPSMDALALRAARERGLGAGAGVVVATDARRREVYSAVYDVGEGMTVARRGEPVVGPAADVAVPGGAVLVGRGVALYGEVFTGSAVQVDDSLMDPSAADLGLLALRELGAPDAWVASDVRDPEPLYLRRPDAAPPAERKSVLTQFRT